MSDDSIRSLADAAMAKSWFYPLTLPDGRTLPSTHGGRVDAIHITRAQMLGAFLERNFTSRSELRAIDLACHQGFFSLQLARAGFGYITGVDAREEHVADANLLASIYEQRNLTARRADVFALDPKRDGMHDLVLMFGLLYHLENPVGALRVARSLCKRACVIETQVVPHLSGMVDWGSYEYVRPLKGCFGIIDEIDETHASEASVTGVCLAPSTEGLLWLLRAVGFSRAEVLPVPDGGYEQLRHGKRVMVAAFV
jgi:hypothetical protein